MGGVGPRSELADTTDVEGGAQVGAAIHSVRAVPPEAARQVAEWAAERSAPLHFHCSEQPAENEEALSAYGATPVQLLAQAGALGPRSVAVHATHLDEADAKELEFPAPVSACARRSSATSLTGSARPGAC